MRKRRTYTIEEKLSIIREHLEQGVSLKEIGERYGYTSSPRCFYEWVDLYNKYGEKAFTKNSCNKYSVEFKQQVVAEYLSGKSSREVAAKYKVGYRTVIEWANGGYEKVVRRLSDLTESQKISIAKYCILHDYNYTKTSEKCNLTKCQVKRLVQWYSFNFKVETKEQILGI